MPPGTRVMVAFPLRRSGRVSHREVVENLRSLGFVRVLADGEPAELSELLEEEDDPAQPDLAQAREVMVVVDRIKVPDGPERDWRERLADSLATCFREGEGEAAVVPFCAPRRVRAERTAYRRHRHPSLHRVLPLSEPPRPDLPQAAAQALLVQQSLRELPGVHGLRRHPGVRCRAGGSRPGALARRGRGGPLVEAALREGEAGAAPVCARRGSLQLHALEGSAARLPRRGALRQGLVPRGDGLSGLEGAEALQAVHPHLPAPIPASAAVPGGAAVRGCGPRRAG